MSVLNTGLATPSRGYTIDNSCRFNDDDSAYLSRTPSSAGNRKTWTWSGWVKRGNIGSLQFLFQQGASQNNATSFRFNSDDTLAYDHADGGATTDSCVTNAVFRDLSSFYHIILQVDVTQATASDRVKIYVNGVEQSLGTTNYPNQNVDTDVNTTNSFAIGKQVAGTPFYLDGYLSEVHFIDGQALTPSSFGETDATYGHWKPIKYTGSYGTNGFYLDFASSASLGNDVSGNNNDFTSSGLASTDQMLDTPTNNFATLNPLNLVDTVTLSEGNLKAVTSTSPQGSSLGTISISSGLWYWEVLQTSANGNNDLSCGVMELSRKMSPQATGGDVYPNSYRYGNDGNVVKHNSTTSTVNTYGAGDIIGWALDLDGNTLKIYKNNSLEYTYSSGVSGTFTPLLTVDGSSWQSVTQIANFGQDSSFAGNKTAQGNADGNGYGDFYYEPPSGFKALCTANLDDPAAGLWSDGDNVNFNTVTYTGTGNSMAVTGVGFQPDLTWLKVRNGTGSHQLHDAVRGATAGTLYSNTTADEDSPYSLTSFDTDGYTTHASNAGWQSGSGYNFVAWNWKANGSGSSNTDGSITSTVSANTDAGFSIVSYTGNGLTNQTVGHGLSQKPDLVIYKDRDSTNEWRVIPVFINDGYYLSLSTTAAQVTSSTSYFGTNTASVLGITGSNSGIINTSGNDIIAYCFHSVDGYSKVGSYTGNGSTDGTFIYTGFRPAWILFKSTASAQSWRMVDSERSPYNTTNAYFKASHSDSEAAGMNTDFVSNGVKLRTTSGGVNNSETYVYLAFAEHPLKYSTAR